MSALPRVALLIETSNTYARGLLSGISCYIREHRPWSLFLPECTRGDKVPSWLPQWEGDGIIARIENRSIAKALKNIRVPIVDVSAARLLPELPWFETDDQGIAQLAVEHLRERGFSSFAFVGNLRFTWSDRRCQYYQAALKKLGCPCVVYQMGPDAAPEDAQIDSLARWIRKLPKPVGVMACYDICGQQVLKACRQVNVAVPDDVAVIGVDNDDLICELSGPPLSSIAPNTSRMGYESAAMLDEMMAGRLVRGATQPIPPLGVVARQSTDVLAIEDQNIARAIHYIRNNACNGITVGDTVNAVPQSRRLMEIGFQKWIGRTPHSEIMRVRIERVKQLLVGTSLSLEVIAERAGFRHVEYLSTAFKRQAGLPPSIYRLLHRPGIGKAPARPGAGDGKSPWSCANEAFPPLRAAARRYQREA